MSSGHAIDISKTIEGNVVDESGMPLIGASVVVVGTNTGTATNIDGYFSLEVPDDADSITVSYIGYVTKTLPITSGLMNIVLQEGNVLDEVVVVGYGTVKKSDVVGSVTSVDVDEATALPSTNVSEMLRGRAPGVQVNLNDPRPGGSSNIVIRGKVSLVGNDPLVIVDGVPYDNINEVAPGDIASIEVLKDASSQAIYGARAANGVILITTKKGKAGKVKINYHGYTTRQSITKNFDLYSAEEFAQLRREAHRTDNNEMYLEDEVIFEPFEVEALRNKNFVDWEDLILEDAWIQSHALNLSGGTENTKVYTSLNYFDQDGLIPTSGFKRGGLRINVDQQVGGKLNLRGNVNYQLSEQDIESNSLNFITISPLAKPFDENGNLVKEPLGEGKTTVNPLWNIRESNNDVSTNLIDLNLVGTYDFTPRFSYQLNTFLRNRNSSQGIYRSSKHVFGDADIMGLATLADNSYREFLIENILNFNAIDDGNQTLNLTAVHAVNQRNRNNTSTVKSGFPNDALGYNGNATVIREATRDVSRRRLVSFLGRARYGLFNKYLLTLTARADGSSVFAENNKWGFFPAAAFAWKLHQEPFFVDNPAITQLKLRLSYGQTGNEGIDPSESLGVADDLPYTFGGVTFGGFAPLNRLPNPDLKWESTTTFNAGLDFGFFNNRLNGTIEYYNASTTDFLLDRLLPGTSGFSVTRFNIGEVSNKGFETALNYDLFREADFTWTAGITFATNDNRIVKLDGKLDNEGEPVDFISQGLFVGEPINNIFQKVFDGIWQEGDEIASSAQPDAMPGDVRVKDLNGDGELTREDNVVFNQDPDWYGSINTSIQYKGFELFGDLYIVQGALRSNPYLASFENGGTLQGIRNGIKVDYYLPESPSNMWPRPRTSTPSNLFALAIQDASYVRLRTLSLGYNLPNSVSTRVGMENLKIYATGTNIFTLTDYKSYSPEVNPGSFPDAKGVTVGLKIQF